MKLINMVQLVNFFESYYNNNQDAHLPVSLSLKLYNFIKDGTKARELFNSKLSYIITQYAEKDENGKPLYSDDGKEILIQDDKREISETEVKKLYNDEIESSFTLTDDDLEKLNLSLKDIFFIKNCL